LKGGESWYRLSRASDNVQPSNKRGDDKKTKGFFAENRLTRETSVKKQGVFRGAEGQEKKNHGIEERGSAEERRGGRNSSRKKNRGDFFDSSGKNQGG